MESLAPHPSSVVNPIDLLEELVSANDWPFDRSSECELAVELSGRWCAYHLWFVWHEQVGGMYFSCHFDLKVPRVRYNAVHALIGGMNEQLWMGHFELGAVEVVDLLAPNLRNHLREIGRGERIGGKCHGS